MHGSATHGESSSTASAPIIAALTSDNDSLVESKTRRPNQKGRHCSTLNTAWDTSDDDSDPETECFELLEEWDHLCSSLRCLTVNTIACDA